MVWRISVKYYVYCLYKGKSLLYVGSSTQLINRLKTHKKDKDFDGALYCELPNKELMLEYEEYGIYNLNPPLNRKVLYRPDKPDVEVFWVKFDMYNLLPEASPDDLMAVCFEYHQYQADIVGIPYSIRHELFHMQDNWTFQREVTDVGVTILARSDKLGKSVDEICTDLGGLTFEQFKYDWMRCRNIRDRI